MANIWIGDFRLNQLRKHVERAELDADLINKFILDSNANTSWLETVAINKLANTYIEDSAANVICMLGFVDCLTYALYRNSNIDAIANQFVSTLQNLINVFTGGNLRYTFYLCSVCHVTDNYFSSFCEKGYIEKDELNSIIDRFNEKVLECSPIPVIDCNSYLSKAGFATYDGIRYTSSTCDTIIGFVEANIGSLQAGAPNAFTPRLTAPIFSGIEAYSQLFPELTDAELALLELPLINHGTEYWLRQDYEGNGKVGLSPYEVKDITFGSTLPDCRAYAWGRLYEINNIAPTLNTELAPYEWYDYTADLYMRGDAPRAGAIACWDSNDFINDGDDITKAGHVAVVEQINYNEDGTIKSIVTSESGINYSKNGTLKSIVTPESGGGGSGNGTYTTTWFLTERSNKDENWSGGDDLRFQGFIYPFYSEPVTGIIKVSKADVYNEDRRLTPAEKEINAAYIWNYLGSRGWTLNAVAGLLGNMEYESSINPGRGEVGGSGYGLVQWTGRSKLMKWCDAQNPPLPYDDIDSQLLRIEHERFHGYKGADIPDDIGVHTPKTLRKKGCSCGQYSYATKDGLGYKYASTYGPKTFYEYSKSTDSPYQLACAFLYNYERPASIIYGAGSKEAGIAKTPAEREEKRKQKRDQRGNAANKWYKYLAPLTAAGYSEEKFIVDNLVIKQITPTRITASFIVKNGKSGTFSISGSDNTERRINMPTETYDLQLVELNSGGLVPNTEYTLTINIISALNEEESIKKDITFCTPQDRPSPAKFVSLSCNSKLASIDSEYHLEADIPEYVGYWKNKCGYDIQLFINGRPVAHKSKNGISHVSKNFKLKTEFDLDDKKCRTGDVIQIGIRVWAKDADDIYVYDNISEAATTSNSICLINNPVQSYLNI